MKTKQKKLPLSIKILLGFVLGIGVGLLLRYSMGESAVAFSATWVTPFSTLFLNLIKMVCIPLVFCSLVMGASSAGDVKSMGRIGGKTIGYFLITTVIAGILAIVISNAVKLGTGMNIATEGLSYAAPDGVNYVDTILNIVPTNIFASLTDGTMLQIIFFALALGLGINLVGKKGDCLREIFTVLTDIMSALTSLIMKYAPIAVCAFMIDTMINYGTMVIGQLAALIAVIYGIAILHILVVYVPTVKVLSKFSLRKFLSTVWPSFAIAFTTMSSAAALPVTLENCEDLGVSNKIRSFVAPLGCTIHMDGTAIYEACCAIFIANLYGLHLSFGAQAQIIAIATIASVGCAGVPGAGLIMLSSVLLSAGIPVEGVAIVMGINTILSPIVTAMNVLGDNAAALFVAKTEHELDTDAEMTPVIE